MTKYELTTPENPHTHVWSVGSPNVHYTPENGYYRKWVGDIWTSVAMSWEAVLAQGAVTNVQPIVASPGDVVSRYVMKTLPDGTIATTGRYLTYITDGSAVIVNMTTGTLWTSTTFSFQDYTLLHIGVPSE